MITKVDHQWNLWSLLLKTKQTNTIPMSVNLLYASHPP